MSLHLLYSKNGGVGLRLQFLFSQTTILQNHHLLFKTSSFLRATTLRTRHLHLPKNPKISYTRFRCRRFLPSTSSIASFKEEEDSDASSPIPDMARAFSISSRTATAVSVCIFFAALSLPLAMASLGQGMGLKKKVLSYLTLLSGFYMAWNIGANDVANAMGTSVGSGALSLRQAVLTAAILEFSGAFFMGTHVTSTMQNGILISGVFQGKENLLFAGLLSCLAAAGTWLQVASFFGWPVSTTHCIVGAMVGFGLV